MLRVMKGRTMTEILWTAEQFCSECGEGVFVQWGNRAGNECTVCGHEHPLDPWNLGENERFEWQLSPRRQAMTLHVVAHA